ncbi:hypothetical protein Vretimale_1848, partial [Volvox reticuliferus]
MVASGGATAITYRQQTHTPRASPPVCAPYARRPARSTRRKKKQDGSLNLTTTVPCATYHLSANAQYVAYLHTRQAVGDLGQARKAGTPVTHAGTPLPAGATSAAAVSSGSSNSSSDNGTVNVHLVVPKWHLPPGQQLVLVGGTPLLGDWDPQRGVRLIPNRSGTAHLVELAVPVDQPIAAKLVLLQDGLPIHWESGNDRMLFLATPPPLPTPPSGSSGTINLPRYLLLCEFEDTNRTQVMLWPPAPIPRSPGTSVLHVTVRGDCLPPTSLAAGAVDDLILTLTGSCRELGDWDPARGVRLQPDPTTPGGWTARVALRLDYPVSGKLVLCSAAALAAAATAGGVEVAVAWEPGADRVLGPTTADKMLLCSWDWGVSGLEPVEMDLPAPQPLPPSSSSPSASSAAATAEASSRALSPARVGALPPPPTV